VPTRLWLESQGQGPDLPPLANLERAEGRLQASVSAVDGMVERCELGGGLAVFRGRSCHHGLRRERDRLRRQARRVFAELHPNGSADLSRTGLERGPPGDFAGVLLDRDPLPGRNVRHVANGRWSVGLEVARELPRRIGSDGDDRPQRPTCRLLQRVEMPAVLERRRHGDDVGPAIFPRLDGGRDLDRLTKFCRQISQRVELGGRQDWGDRSQRRANDRRDGECPKTGEQ
jgi:hypothetical protein